jgi:hypothetical protein
MGVKISELPRTQSAGHSDNLVINHNGATSRITVEDLMESYLSDAGFLTESDLADYLSSNLSSYLSEYVTADDLSEYVTQSDLDNAGFLTASSLPDYLSEYVTESDLSEYVTQSDLENAGFLTAGDLDDYLSEYVTQSDLDNAGFVSESYLSEALGSYVSDSYLSEVLSDYISGSDFGTYLSEAGAVTDDNFSDAMDAYFSDGGGEAIYNAISQYIHS